MPSVGVPALSNDLIESDLIITLPGQSGLSQNDLVADDCVLCYSAYLGESWSPRFRIPAPPVPLESYVQ